MSLCTSHRITSGSLSGDLITEERRILIAHRLYPDNHTLVYLLIIGL
jgi:hypothetical protein